MKGILVLLLMVVMVMAQKEPVHLPDVPSAGVLDHLTMGELMRVAMTSRDAELAQQARVRVMELLPQWNTYFEEYMAQVRTATAPSAALQQEGLALFEGAFRFGDEPIRALATRKLFFNYAKLQTNAMFHVEPLLHQLVQTGNGPVFMPNFWSVTADDVHDCQANGIAYATFTECFQSGTAVIFQMFGAWNPELVSLLVSKGMPAPKHYSKYIDVFDGNGRYSFWAMANIRAQIQLILKSSSKYLPLDIREAAQNVLSLGMEPSRFNLQPLPYYIEAKARLIPLWRACLSKTTFASKEQRYEIGRMAYQAFRGLTYVDEHLLRLQ